MTPCRPWKYDAAIPEFFVQTSDTTVVKRSDMERWVEQGEGEERSYRVKKNIVVFKFKLLKQTMT